MSYQPNGFERFMTSEQVKYYALGQLVIQPLLIILFLVALGIPSYFSIGLTLIILIYLLLRIPLGAVVEKKKTKEKIQKQLRRDEEVAERALRDWRDGNSAGAKKARELLLIAWQTQFPGFEAPLWLGQASLDPGDEAQAKILRSYYEKSKDIDDALVSPYLNDGDRLLAANRQQALASEVVEKLSSEIAVKSAATLQEALSKAYLLD